MEWKKQIQGNTKPTKLLVWAYILGYVEENSYSPSLEEISQQLAFHFGYAVSREHARQIVNLLIEDGKLSRVKGKWRNIRINESNTQAESTTSGKTEDSVSPQPWSPKEANSQRPEA